MEHASGPREIAVIGAGTMGSGIAQLAATHGARVRLMDANPACLRAGQDLIRRNLERAVEKGKLSSADYDAVLQRIDPRSEIADLGDIDLAIEAVIEDITVKKEVLRRLCSAAGPSAVLATNTSSLSVAHIAEGADDPSRVVGMHFFNPAPVMPLVEIIAATSSGKRAIEMAYQAAKAWGKTPVLAKDTPGFIVNRVARGYYLEALRLFDEGIAGLDEIDAILRRHAGFKMGPFELMDLVGLDVNLAVSSSVWEQMDRHPRFTPHAIQQRLVAEGLLGRKSGRGFYLYENDRPPVPAVSPNRKSFTLDPLLLDVVRTFGERLGARAANSTEHYILARVLGAVFNEAAIAFTDGVATREDIDVAMQKGTNYPQGPLSWAGAVGHRNVRGVLARLNATVAAGRYEPARYFGDGN